MMPTAKLGLLMTGVFIGGLSCWHAFARTHMLQTACEIGLPNMSLPSSVDSDDAKCSILGSEATFQGVVISQGGNFSFTSNQFPQITTPASSTDDRAWFSCSEAVCGRKLREQLSINYLDGCINHEAFHIGFASVTARGWVTVSNETSGRLAVYPRQFYVKELAEIGPPPLSHIASYRNALMDNNSCQ